MATFILDVDLTICKAVNRDYENAIPYMNIINKINTLHSEGNKIILFTARGMLSNNNDLDKINTNVKPILIQWLNKHNVKYDELIMGKPFFEGETYYIGDEVLTINQFLFNDSSIYKSVCDFNNYGKDI